MLQSHAYFSLITTPTRVITTPQTVIDHILTNDNSSIIHPGVLLYKISDHFPIYCTISQPIPNKSHFEAKHTYRNVHSIDGDKFRSDLEMLTSPMLHGTLHPTITPKDLEDSFAKLAKNISEVIDHHAPVLTPSRKQKRWQTKPWLTKGLIISIKNKQRLYKTFFSNGNDFEKSYFKKYSNKLTREKNLSKKLYYKEALSLRKNNPKELWKLIKTVIPPKRTTSLPMKVQIDNNTSEDPMEISQHFNEYFAVIGESIAKNATDNSVSESAFTKYLRNSEINTIVLEPPQPIEVYDIINTLNPHKACGHDNISPFFLRLGSEVLALILSQLYFHVFKLGYFPQILKTAKIMPIFKSGSKLLVNNYRPISLFPSLSKILEKLIKSRLLKFCGEHDVIYDYQYGFRNNHSVVHALLNVTSLCYDSIQTQKFTALLLMDFQKAFDTVSHKILLKKLYHYGVRGPAYTLMESYLSERNQNISLNNCTSPITVIKTGVPQGSILGPLLYLRVNDICNALSCKPRLFADDTCLIIENSSCQTLNFIVT